MKNYKVYKSKIKALAKLSKVKIIYRKPNKHSDDGYYFNRQIVIFKQDHLTPEYEIAILLHEMGHFFDSQNPKVNSNKLENAYGKYLKLLPVNQEEHHLILDCEKRAWVQGIVIAKLLNIPLGKWYIDVKIAGLRFYREKIPLNY